MRISWLLLAQIVVHVDHSCSAALIIDAAKQAQIANLAEYLLCHVSLRMTDQASLGELLLLMLSQLLLTRNKRFEREIVIENFTVLTRLLLGILAILVMWWKINRIADQGCLVGVLRLRVDKSRRASPCSACLAV